MKRVIAFFAMAATLNAAHGTLGHTDLDSRSPRGFKHLIGVAADHPNKAVLIVGNKSENQWARRILGAIWAKDRSYRGGPGEAGRAHGPAFACQVDTVAFFLSEGAEAEAIALPDRGMVPGVDVTAIPLLLINGIFEGKAKALCYVEGNGDPRVGLQRLERQLRWWHALVPSHQGTQESMRVIFEWKYGFDAGGPLAQLLLRYQGIVGLMTFNDGRPKTVDPTTRKLIDNKDRSIVIQLIEDPLYMAGKQNLTSMVDYVLDGNTTLRPTMQPLTDDGKILLAKVMISYAVKYAEGTMWKVLGEKRRQANVDTPSKQARWHDGLRKVLDRMQVPQNVDAESLELEAARITHTDELMSGLLTGVATTMRRGQEAYALAMAGLTAPETGMSELAGTGEAGTKRLHEATVVAVELAVTKAATVAAVRKQ